jgi:dephospho-CoA kinase
MHIIGITGPTGAGKSLLTEYVKQRGIPCIDADEVYHGMLSAPTACVEALRKTFGEGVVAADGSVDRAALGAIVFNSPKKLELLNATVLPLVLKELRLMIAAIAKNGYRAVVVDAPTLIESGFHKECNTVISVLAPKELRTERIRMRDSISRERAQLRVNAQREDEFYRVNSHYVLVNENDEESFKQSIDALLSGMGL